jgi:hypothetical protein
MMSKMPEQLSMKILLHSPGSRAVLGNPVKVLLGFGI